MLHGTVANTAPLPQNLRFVSAAPLEAVALISMLLPVHAPLAGDVMLTVGGVPPVGFATVTLTDAVAALPAASVAVNVSVCVPFGVLVVFHVVDAVVPLTPWLYSVVVLSSFSTNCVAA